MKILNVNKRNYPVQSQMFGIETEYKDSTIKDDGYVEITAVLTEGEIGDFAVYIGEGSPEWVANFGDKLSWKEATCHFPFIPEEKYRG